MPSPTSWPNLFQSTPPARGATSSGRAAISFAAISIHAPREGGDHIAQNGGYNRFISIHAPREGGDNRKAVEQGKEQYFNPRPPRGGRHHVSGGVK